MQLRTLAYFLIALADLGTARVALRDAEQTNQLVHQLNDLKRVLGKTVTSTAKLRQDPLIVFEGLGKIINNVGDASSILGNMLPNLPKDDDHLDGDRQQELCNALRPVLYTQASVFDELIPLVKDLPIVGSFVRGAVETVQALLLTTTSDLVPYLPVCYDKDPTTILDILRAEQKTYNEFTELLDNLDLNQSDTKPVEMLEIELEAGITSVKEVVSYVIVTTVVQPTKTTETDSTTTITTVVQPKETTDTDSTTTITTWTTVTSSESSSA